MSGPATPVRVIYAKRTSVGAWDVVAKTANITEADALGLAERLLLGAPPHDAEIVEEAASLAWPDGGRVILRFSPYAWRDPQGRRVFMSDIVWLSDADFERVRCNPFAILPRCDDVFETLTELPPVQLPAHTASDDALRLGALAPVSDAESLIAAAIRFDRVLVIDDAQRVAKAELFTLLLPPAVRPLFTFQTRAFRVPDVVPRVTMAETFFPSLHDGPWEAVLPDIAHDIPVQLARSLVALAAQPDVLHEAHMLRAASALPLDNLRTEVTRVVQLAGVAEQFRRDPATALQDAARRGTTDGAAILRALAATAPADAVMTATLALTANGADHVHATRLLGVLERERALTIAAAMTQRLTELRLAPDAALGTALAARLARGGDAASLLDLLASAPHEAASWVRDTDAGADPPLAELLAAFRERAAARRRLAGATRFIDALAALPRVALERPGAAVLARDTLRAALDEVQLDAASVGHVRSLQPSLDRLATKLPTLALPQLATDAQLAELRSSADADAGHIRKEHSDEMAAVLACTLLMRATGPEAGSRVSLAHALLGMLPQQQRAAAGVVLKQCGLGEAEIVALPGAARVLAQFGGNAERVATVQDIVAAAARLEGDAEAVSDVAAAVVQARVSGVQLATGDASALQAIAASLARALSHSGTATRAQHESGVELALDILAGACDPDAFRVIQDAALGDGGMLVRLRRLARAGAECRSASDRYHALARAIESPQSGLDEATRARLRRDLNTRGVQARIIDVISGVMEPHGGK